MTSSPLFITGASGQLGRLVVDALLSTLPPERIVAGLRDLDSKASAAFRARGVAVRLADYERPDTLDAAFAGVGRLLLISSSEVGRRLAQHRNAIEAAARAGVGLLAYTSVLKADVSPIALAEEHRQTEDVLRASGLPFAVLRNGWYTENYMPGIPAALAHGVLLGSAGEGRISAAARADYAAAAAAVLTAEDGPDGRVYELAGDTAFTLPEFAAELTRASGRPVAYRDLPEAEYREALIGTGMPEPFAALLADSDVGAARGFLFDEGRALSRLIGRPTAPWAGTLAAALPR